MMSDNLSAKISIISPLYDKERYVAAMIESVINQSYPHWELFLIDDGSTDRSVEIAAQFEDDRIKILYRSEFSDKKGASVCRNIGINRASGDFVVFLDADDLLLPTCLEQRLLQISKYPEYDIWILNMARFVGSTDNIQPLKMKDYISKVQYRFCRNKKTFMLNKFLTYNTLWSICNPIWRRSGLTAIGGFNEDFQRLQDPEIHTRALLSDLRFKFMKFDTEADVLVRDDIDRRQSITKRQMFEKVKISIENYINTIKPLLIQSDQGKKVHYLYCYSLLIEQITNGYYNANDASADDRQFYLDSRAHFYKSIDLQLSGKYLFVVKLYRTFSKYKLLNKLRIPAVLVNIYKLIL